MLFSIFATSALASTADEDPIAQLEAGLGRRRASWSGYDRWAREEESEEDESFDMDDFPETNQADLEERFGTLSEEEARQVLTDYVAERAVARAVTEELARMSYEDHRARGLDEDDFYARGGWISDVADWWNNSGVGEKVGNVGTKLWNKASSMNWSGRRRSESTNPILAKFDRMTVELARHIYENRAENRRMGYARSAEEELARSWFSNAWDNVKTLANDAVTAWNADKTPIDITKIHADPKKRAIEERGIRSLIQEARSIEARAERLLEEDREERAVFNDDWYN